MSASIHDKLKRVRKPRVHITYEVHIGDATEVIELPFVVGVLGDFSGDPRKELAPFEDRKFVEINRDNFNSVMERMAPGLDIKVDNKLEEGAKDEIGVELSFSSIKDFDPGRIVEKVPELRKLMQTRAKLRDLMSKADRSRELGPLLEQVLRNEGGELQSLSEKLTDVKAED